MEHFNLSTSPYVTHDENTFFYINGKKIKRSLVDENPDILGFNTTSEEKGKSAYELLSQATREVWLN